MERENSLRDWRFHSVKSGLSTTVCSSATQKLKGKAEFVLLAKEGQLACSS